jgi:uncharacterized membrane protein
MTGASRSRRLDALRGFLVLLMIIYHAAYVGVTQGILSLELYAGFWWLFPRAIAAGFLALSGWSLDAKKAGGAGYGYFARRAARLAVPALCVSAVSFIMFGKGSFVFFGILHALALTSLLAWPLLGRPAPALAAALAALAAGLALGPLRFDWPYLAWLGLRPRGLYPVDYLPLLPWFAWAAFGAAAHALYRRLSLRPSRPERRRAPGRLTRRSNGGEARAAPAIARALAFLGRHSLVVYLAHLPLLFGLALVLKLVL